MGIFGLLLTFYPTAFSAFARIQAAGPDSRMIHYLLEHSFLWLTRRPSHENLWSPPIFFPHPNTAAYTESNLGVAPFYLIWRLLGLGPETSYQLFAISLMAANYVAGYFFLSAAFGFRRLPSSFGAFLFAFGNSRVARLPHANLICHVYILMALLAVARIYTATTRAHGEADDRQVRRWIAVLFASLVLQAYAGYYFAFFVALLLAGLLLGALAFRPYREVLFKAVRRNGWAITMSLSVGAFALLPFALPYWRALSELGAWRYEDFDASLPGVESWVFMGRRNWLYGSLSSASFFAPSVVGLRNVNGVGYLTAIVCAWGVWRHRQRACVRLMILLTALLLLLALRFPGGFSLWEYVHRWVPGAEGIRSVGRIGMLLLIPAGVAAAFALELLVARQPAWLAASVMALVAIEQLNLHDLVEKEELRERYTKLASLIPFGCGAFYFCGAHQARRTDLDGDALWMQAAAGVPTLNGRAARRPPGWQLDARRASEQMGLATIRHDLETWLSGKGFAAADVCIVFDYQSGKRARRSVQPRGLSAVPQAPHVLELEDP